MGFKGTGALTMQNADHPSRSRRRLPFEQKIQLLAVLGGFPALIGCLLLIWLEYCTPLVQCPASPRVIVIWLSCGVASRNHVSFSLRTIGNLVSAIREGDYS